MTAPRRVDSGQWRQRIGALALVAVGLIFIWKSLADLPFGTIDNPGPGIAPLALAALLVASALWSIAGSSATVADGLGQDDEPQPDPGAMRHAVFVILGIVAAALAFGVLGYRLTIFSGCCCSTSASSSASRSSPCCW